MRRRSGFLVWLIASLFFFSAASALATHDHACCADGCKGLVACVSLSCQSCTSVGGPVAAVPAPAASARPLAPVAQPTPWTDAPLIGLWKPPKA